MNSQQLLQYYLTNQLQGLPANKIAVFWEEVFDQGLSIQYFNSKCVLICVFF